MPRISGH
jgi:hypothetical protein